MSLPPLQVALRERVYPVTRRIAIGQFATEIRARHLLERGVTHILNVGEAASIVSASTGFRRVADRPVADLGRIPDELALSCLDTLHEMLGESNSQVYVHCIACQNRSPTIVWLYLLACGMEGAAAKELITRRCPDAVPGHALLVDDRLLACVRQHGIAHFLPLDDVSILEPAY